MPEYAAFEHFARDLFLRSNLRYFEMSSSDQEEHDPIPLIEDASYVLGLFAHGHCVSFDQIFKKTEKQLLLQTDEQFFKFVIPRCLNLIDSDRYFYSIMLVAGFLKEFLNFLRDTRVCYRFHFTAYKCLAAVFERSFKNSFESNGGWNAFGKYLKHVDEAYAASGDKFILTSLHEGDVFLLKEVKGLIKHCDDISDDFNLNEYENALLMDDDVKVVEESLDYDEADEDPLNLFWPPDDEVMNEKIKDEELNRALDDRYAPLDSESSDESEEDIDESEEDIDESEEDIDESEEDIDDSEEDIDETEEDIDDSGVEDSDVDIDHPKEDCYPSILWEYIYRIEGEAEMRLGTEEFSEKMKLRPCPCCGIKCYQFSMNIFTKQIELAITSHS